MIRVSWNMNARAKWLSWGIAFVVLLVGCSALFAPEPVPEVKGLSRRDVLAIRSAVRRDVWARVFPSWSVAAFKSLPGNAWLALRTRIGLPFPVDGTWVVGATCYQVSNAVCYCYHFRKQDERWLVIWSGSILY
jgi:hypothetical protein